MDIRQLKYFIAVARECNFTRASHALHVAQPAISRQIQQLEDHLGVQLFDRGGRVLQLTPAGRFLYERGQSILEEIELTIDKTVRIGRGARSRFDVGFSLMTLNSVLPAIIREFGAKLPHVEIGMHDLNSQQQFEALRAGRIDVGFGRIPAADDDICSERVATEPFSLAVPSHFEVAGLASVSLAQVAMQPYILFPVAYRPSFADDVLKLFEVRGLRPTISAQAKSLHAAITMVAAGLGVTLVPRSMRALHTAGVAYRDISDVETHSHVVLSYRRKDASPEVRLLRKMVNDSLAKGD